MDTYIHTHPHNCAAHTGHQTYKKDNILRMPRTGRIFSVFLRKCSATMRIWFQLLSSYLTDYSNLRNLQWSSLISLPRLLRDFVSLLALQGCILGQLHSALAISPPQR